MTESHLLTVDVEASGRGIRMEGRDPNLAAAMDTFLELLEQIHGSATFFVLGEDAAPLASVLSRCVAAGHELACHGMRHVRTDSLGPEEFRTELRDALAVLEDTAQVPCRGYRAPWFSAPYEKEWFFHILGEAGIEYDASLRVPVETRLAGESRHGIRLVPVPTLAFGAARIGALGGLALRVLPEVVICRMLRRCATYGQPACVYLHPYEWYPRHRALHGLSPSALRRSLLTSRTLPRLKWLAERTQLVPIAQWLGTTK